MAAVSRPRQEEQIVRREKLILTPSLQQQAILPLSMSIIRRIKARLTQLNTSASSTEPWESYLERWLWQRHTSLLNLSVLASKLIFQELKYRTRCSRSSPMMALLFTKHLKITRVHEWKATHLDQSLETKTILRKSVEIEEHRVTITLSILTRKTSVLGRSNLLANNMHRLSTPRACNPDQERLIMIK